MKDPNTDFLPPAQLATLRVFGLNALLLAYRHLEPQ